MALAAWVNHDGVTLYQAIKVVMIGVLWLVLSWLVVLVSADTLVRALYGVLVLVVLVFFLSKAFSSTAYILGGGREGDIFARAGVIWKAGLFFLPLFIADWLSRPDRWIQVACARPAGISRIKARPWLNTRKGTNPSRQANTP